MFKLRTHKFNIFIFKNLFMQEAFIIFLPFIKTFLSFNKTLQFKEKIFLTNSQLLKLTGYFYKKLPVFLNNGDYALICSNVSTLNS